MHATLHGRLLSFREHFAHVSPEAMKYRENLISLTVWMINLRLEFRVWLVMGKWGMRLNSAPCPASAMHIQLALGSSVFHSLPLLQPWPTGGSRCPGICVCKQGLLSEQGHLLTAWACSEISSLNTCPKQEPEM